MKLYLITYIEETFKEGDLHKELWVGTQAERDKLKKSLRADEMVNIQTQDVDVPTDKAGLLDFLNWGCRPVAPKESGDVDQVPG